MPVVPRGAGTGLSGGANAVAGGIVVSFERMTAVLRIDPVERLAVVQPGVVNDDLRAACAEHGLWYPPDPASSPWSTIGGNVATNAGGMCCVKYGVTGDYVLALEVVTGTGELVRIGRGRPRASPATTCVAARRLRGHPRHGHRDHRAAAPGPPGEQTVVGFFDSLVAAGEAVAAVARAGRRPLGARAARPALPDRGRRLEEPRHRGRLRGHPARPGRRPRRGGVAEAEAVLACFEAAGATLAARSDDEAESEAMFAARRLAYPALERLGPVLTEDVCVPVGRVPEMLARVQGIGERHDVLIANIAHAGDGNLHPLIIMPPGDEAAQVRAQAAFDEIIIAALACGGTVTGEHGVGLLKRDGLVAELSAAVVEMHHAIRRALDPHGMLNPGKVVS